MSKPIDYDAPRQTAAELEDNGITELNALSGAKRSPRVEPDEADTAESLDLPGADLAGEELTVAVVPMQSDEFRCARCFLVHHRSQLAGQSNGEQICRECY
jgi:hypothetical protein